MELATMTIECPGCGQAIQVGVKVTLTGERDEAGAAIARVEAMLPDHRCPDGKLIWEAMA